jgi:type IV pilus assembly protein PilM
MRAVGIDIADNVISIVELRQRFGVCALLTHAQQALPDGAVQKGVIHDTAGVSTVLKECMKNAKPAALVAGTASFSVPEFTVFTHTFTFPRTLKPKEIEEGIRVQFSEYFPFDLDRMAADWLITQKSEQTQSVFVGAVEKTYIDHILEVAKACNITVAGIDVESMSAARALLPIPKKMEAYLLIDSGASVTSLSLFDDAGLQMTASLNCAGAMLTEHIAKKRGMARAAAEEWKKQIVLSDPAVANVLPIIDGVYGAVVAEASRLMHYFETAFTKKIAGVYLCGGSSQLKGMDDYLAKRLSRPVHRGNPLQHIRNHDILPTSEDAVSYTNAIGLTLGMVNPKRRVAFNFLRTHLWSEKD